ncbi:glycoside hydrolase family 108 protein [Bradyrhizobium sp. CCBAU 51753]|uniref:glycoside hydrolase family 108 protein n=1 Tax=Bradyrhizobium sp. CCBAU 51753 TaxID=1325100 RepID=UPI00188D8F0F|nr:glycosyl hydrolase 108 family protein [Bradyrhizobium sp. CCBAU 51753]QOZ25268.1 N-acetylmuramidase [Bradyrhizobium sp. CCBAU 51753]
MVDQFGKDHSWQDAMKIYLKFEGGKDDDPVDPGGRTNQGVIQREFSAWLRKNGKPNRDVFTMTDAERDEIYWENYGQKVRFNELPPGVDLVVADGAINSGPSQSVKWVQRALGLTADGVLGNVTLQAILNYPDHDDLIAKVVERRNAFLRSLKTFYHFGKGWLSRTSQLQKIGQAWAMGSVGPAVAWSPNMNKKATIVDAQPLVSTAPSDATTAGGAVTTTLTTVQSTLQPLQGASHFVDQALTAIMVLGALATAGGLLWAWYARRKNSALTDALDLAPAPAVNDNDIVPDEVKAQYVDPTARGSETGNIAPGTVTTSGRQAGDTEDRVNPPAPIPAGKQSAA